MMFAGSSIHMSDDGAAMGVQQTLSGYFGVLQLIRFHLYVELSLVRLDSSSHQSQSELNDPTVVSVPCTLLHFNQY